MEDNKDHLFSGINYCQRKICAIDQRIRALSVFNYSMDLIERILERGEFQDDPAWQEIARLLEVRNSYELKLEELSWQVKPSNLSQIEFYSFTLPKNALIAVKAGVKPLTVYASCVAEVYNQQVGFILLSVDEVRKILRQSICEETKLVVTEEFIQEELLDLGRYANEPFYQGSVLLIENKFV
ncbi:hypothetical protein [Candidatus Enterococcus murrayae]|uniref:Uncharacterized protein n=1 Tax=Candidatus Enterococcus murrayae TaxID=2815321 RepID=A0ABS3HCI8_9ENTE|nr:hypothetical protein [Enterococcus sp. MJM16]MBO0451150.1 hypothetical protein [Enterococcus sp. MJM16]